MLPDRAVDVRFEGVGFAYPGGPPVLVDIDLDIPAGRRVAVVGETGSGKSTIAKLLTRLMDPSAGRVLLDGIDLRDISEASLRSSVVLVPQEGFLFDDTLAANVRYGRLDASEAEIVSAAQELGLGDWVDGLPEGSRRRSASAASRCRRGSGSWWRCCGPSSPTPTCSSSTRRPVPSTRSWRPGSVGPWSG